MLLLIITYKKNNIFYLHCPRLIPVFINLRNSFVHDANSPLKYKLSGLGGLGRYNSITFVKKNRICILIIGNT